MVFVVIVGGCGFLGQCLAREILRRDSLAAGATGAAQRVSRVVLADIAVPAAGHWLFPDLESSARIEARACDIATAATAAELLALAPAGEAVSVFHLSAVMSGQGETDFDLAWRVNLDGIRHVLEACRGLGTCPRVVFTSTHATFGSDDPDLLVEDSLRATPHTTYGATKRCAELLLCDYSRKGFVDGRVGRLPTAVVRAGKPNGATTGCFSSVIREPLNGVDVTLPVAGTVMHAVGAHSTVVAALLQLHEVSPSTVARLGYDRTVNLPSCTTCLDELVDALHRVVPAEAHARLGRITFEVDAHLSSIVDSMPKRVDSTRAEKILGIEPNPALDDMIRAYARDFPGAVRVPITQAARL